MHSLAVTRRQGLIPIAFKLRPAGQEQLHTYAPKKRAVTGHQMRGQPHPSCTDGRKVASCAIADILVDAIDAAVDFQG